MTKKNIRIINELGIHARPAGMLANTASKFSSDIKLIKDHLEVNATKHHGNNDTGGRLRFDAYG
jgi:phosphotransferase system HPr (HPr) family protein